MVMAEFASGWQQGCSELSHAVSFLCETRGRASLCWMLETQLQVQVCFSADIHWASGHLGKVSVLETYIFRKGRVVPNGLTIVQGVVAKAEEPGWGLI